MPRQNFTLIPPVSCLFLLILPWLPLFKKFHLSSIHILVISSEFFFVVRFWLQDQDNGRSQPTYGAGVFYMTVSDSVSETSHVMFSFDFVIHGIIAWLFFPCGVYSWLPLFASAHEHTECLEITFWQYLFLWRHFVVSLHLLKVL